MTTVPDLPHLLQHMRLAWAMTNVLGLLEVILALTRRSGSGARSTDRGSFVLIWVVILVGSFAATRATLTVPAADSALLRSLAPLAIALFVFGLLLRWYSIFYLGKYFTVNVAIAEDHRVVDTGPYRLIRHPSYTGALLMWCAIGIAYGNWLGWVFAILPATAVFMRRIRIEEEALGVALGEAYASYVARTRRLIPFLY